MNRLSTGFGPYTEVLDGLLYGADGLGLLPDDRIGTWVESEFARLRAELRGF